MTYIEQFEAELLKKLNGTEDEASIAPWVSEKVLESYRNGITAGQKTAPTRRLLDWLSAFSVATTFLKDMVGRSASKLNSE
jgi:hypothetical protein